MDKKTQIAAVAVVLVVVVAAVAVLLLTKDNGNGGSEETGDTYYIYLDGMGDVNGWHVGTGDDSLEGFESAMKADGIKYSVSKGYITDINGVADPDAKDKGFGLFVYLSTTVKDPYAGNFFAGPSIDAINGNIIYISYGVWTYENNNMSWTVNPNTAPETMLTTGPFAQSADYKPLDYSETYHFYLDGMGDINGWYTGTGANGMEAFKNALEGKVEYSINGNWVQDIGGTADPDAKDKGYGFFTYTAVGVENPSTYYFGSGPAIDTTIGNIVYISYGVWTYENNVMSWELNPNSTTANITGSGPFAA